MNNLKYELELWNKGLELVLGIDEVGRGSLAGPLVIAGVVLNKDEVLEVYDKVTQRLGLPQNLLPYLEITDSKLLNLQKRQYLAEFIKKHALCYEIVEIDNVLIDQEGVGKCNLRGFSTVFDVLSKKLHISHALTDYFKIYSLAQSFQTNIKKGDRFSLTVSSASILAKTYRDGLMAEMHKTFPQYHFDINKGYATKKHIAKIKEFGYCTLHRKSFKIKNYSKVIKN